MAVLALAARLTGELALTLRAAANGLPVGDLRSPDIGLHLELPQHAVDKDLQVQFAHAGDHGLVGLRIGGDPEGGILLRKGLQGLAEFFHVALGLGLHGDRDDRFGDEQGLEDDRVGVDTERVAGGGVLEAEHRTEVAGPQFIHLLALVGLEQNQTGDAFLLVLGGVQHIAALLQDAAVHAHEGELAVGVGHYLEGQGAERSAVVTGPAGFGAVGQHALDGRNVHGGGEIVDHRVQNQLHALVLEGGAAEHGHHAVMDHSEADAAHQLLLGQLAVLEERLDQFLVGLGHRFHQLLAPLLGLGLHVGGNLILEDVRAEVVGVDDRLVAHQIDDSLEIALGADRQLDRHGIGLEAFPDLAVDLEEVGAGTVHLVDEHDPGHVVAIGLPPDGFGLGLDAAHGAEHRHDTIENPHRAFHLDGEIDVAGGVDDVDPIVLPAGGNGGGGDGDAPLTLLFHPVGDGGAIVDLAHLVDHARVEQNPFGRGGLAGVDMSGDTDISDAFQGVGAGHGKVLRGWVDKKRALLYRLAMTGVWGTGSALGSGP